MGKNKKITLNKSIDKLTNDKVEKDLNSKIFAITQKIQNDHPELIKYLEEIPITIPHEKNPQISNKILKGYYNSLCDILDKYEIEHPNKTK